MKLIAIGDNVCDCYIDENIFFPGGNCVNVAVHAKRCGAQAVNYTGVFGNDFMADYIMECLSKENVTATNSRRMYAETSQPCVKHQESCRAVRPQHQDAIPLSLNATICGVRRFLPL